MTNPIYFLLRSRIYTALVLLFVLLLFGVSGFMLLANYGIVDALYMTVITVTTVGFGEVAPLNDEAKLFTVILILTSVIVVGYALTVITEYILSKNNKIQGFNIKYIYKILL